VHHSDLHLIRGFYGVHPELPAPLAAEGVGRVVEVAGANQDVAGQRGVILPTYEHGTWADQAVVADHNVVAVSDHADALQLAMIGISPLTAVCCCVCTSAYHREIGSLRQARIPRSANTSSSSPSSPVSRRSISDAARRPPRKS
jgi:NADPH:quinone reductase-like Zn-dependent oxidoreductase